MAYQSFGDEVGDSNSAAKLTALRLEQLGSFVGRSILDVGCNEGYFCLHAAQAGAKEVIGLDISEQFILNARKRAAESKLGEKVRYLLGSWDQVPNQKFDVIFFLSAVHYADDQRAVIRKLIGHLTPNGTLILECGVVDSDKVEFVSVKRAIDERKFPTIGMIRDILKDDAWKLMGASVAQAGDPIPRKVFHVKPFKPIVCLVSGKSYSGKSTLAREFGRHGIEWIALDDVLTDINRIGCESVALQEFVRSRFHGERLHEIYNDLTGNQLLESFISHTFRLVKDRMRSDRLIVVEGHLLTFEQTLKEFVRAFESEGLYVWEVSRA